jgi:glucoamylase
MLVRTLGLACVVLDATAFSIPRLAQLNHFLGVGHAQNQQQPLQDTLDGWIHKEERIALEKLLANIAPGGRNVDGKGVADGTVIASPSQDEPDYWYQCGCIVLTDLRPTHST